MTSLRFLTYNTQLRSWLMEMGFPPSLPPTYTAPERAKFIAQKVNASPFDYDVVGFNEVFDEDARDILSDELTARFPFQVSKADTFHCRIEQPGLSDDIMEKVWSIVLGPLADLASLAMLKFEDSGLFFASRFPFATEPITPAAALLLGPVAVAALGGQLPVVRFLMYADSTGNDARAAKGVLYVRLKVGSQRLHCFISHTQADDEKAEENASERGNQIATVAAFIQQCVGQVPPFTEEVFFMGDLNIVGGGAADPAPPAEWSKLFTGAGVLASPLVDRWGEDQCPGGSSGRTDPGFTADVVYPPLKQRLDYLFTSASSTLAVQHLQIDHALADPEGVLPYVSDHLPLRADINNITTFCTPATASVTPDVIDVDVTGALREGTVDWYRYDTPGTYDFLLSHNGADTRFDIYLGDDFSTPQPPYRNVSNPDRGQRFVLVAPFFVKVSLENRHSESSYRLRTHRHQGRTLEDALVLIPGQTYHEGFPASPFNMDSADADWDDSESKWFIVETPRIPVSGPIDLSVTVNGQTEEAGGGDQPTKVSVTLGKWDGVGPPASEIDRTEESDEERKLAWQAGDNEHFVVLVKRFSGVSTKVRFDISAATTLSLLRTKPAGQMTLTCKEETSGWGSDDIALKLSADGAVFADIPNSIIGDFDDDSVRMVGDKVTDPLIPYLQGVEVTFIEEDDIDDNDVGSATIPLVSAASGAPSFTIVTTKLDGSIEGKLRIEVDDGVYEFACVISPWSADA